MASENRLGISLIFQQDSTDNYLMSESKSEGLYGVFLRPNISYKHESSVETFSINAQESIERFNISEYNIENPFFAVNYHKIMERSAVDLGYEKNVLSTLTSEFKDSGNITRESSKQKTDTAKALWNYQLSSRDSIAINSSWQTIAYENSAYADLTNKNAQLSWQNELSERASVYAALSLAQYKSAFAGEFPVAPRLIQGYLLCPPNSALVSETSCVSSIPAIGDAENTTTSSGLLVGAKWNIWEQLKLSLAAGASNSRVKQHITTPLTSVEFGPPIDQRVSFGGERVLYNSSRMTTASMDLTYQHEVSTYSLGLSRQIQPSSNGGLWKTEAIEGSFRLSLSEIDWLYFDFLYKKFLTFNEKVINTAAVDRDILSASIKYGYNFSPTLTGSLSIGYRRQEANESNLSKAMIANAMQGALTITYAPNDWTW